MSAIEMLGIAAITVMVASYGLEHRAPVFILVFSIGCAMAAVYAILIASYPFFIAEAIWSVVALRRWRRAVRCAA